jgi:hypothetical protein
VRVCKSPSTFQRNILLHLENREVRQTGNRQEAGDSESERVYSSETSMSLYLTTQRCFPESSILLIVTAMRISNPATKEPFFNRSTDCFIRAKCKYIASFYSSLDPRFLVLCTGIIPAGIYQPPSCVLEWR